MPFPGQKHLQYSWSVFIYYRAILQIAERGRLFQAEGTAAERHGVVCITAHWTARRWSEK
jgi:hypothetical protein